MPIYLCSGGLYGDDIVSPGKGRPRFLGVIQYLGRAVY